MSSKNESRKVRTVGDYLFGCVNFAVPEEAVEHLSFERGTGMETALPDVDTRTKELLKADLYIWICMGAGRTNNVTDSDNGWSHSEGGYTLSDNDKERMLNYAKSIYARYDEEFPYDDSVEMKLVSFGIAGCDYDAGGFPMPHIALG